MIKVELPGTCEASRTLAQQASHPYSLANALLWATTLHQFRREAPAAHEQVEVLTTLATEQGFAYWIAMGTVLHGWALVEQGQVEEGIVHIRRGVDVLGATEIEEALRTFVLVWLAEAYRRLGQAEDGLTLLAQAFKTGEQMWEPMRYLIKGQLLLSLPRPNQPEAETCFRKALELARRQEAKFWELKTAMSLSRQWQQEGKRHKERKLLGEIYGWFTEGFDTTDLKEAKTLLEELS